MANIKGQIYVPNKDNPASEEDYDLILPQTTADQIEGFSGKATQEDAEAGTSDDKFMSPLRVWDAIKKYMTEFLLAAVFTGIVKAVTPAASSNNNEVPTTSWVRNFITVALLEGLIKTYIVEDYLTAGNGYIKFGSWTGGLIIQWGYQKQLTVEPVVYPLPVNTVCCVWAHSINDRQDPGTYHSILSEITPVGVQILAGQYNAPAAAYSGVSAYWGMIGC